MTTGGTMKVDATCCDAEVRYPTDYNLLEDGSELIDRLLDKFCARHKVEKPRTHRVSWDAYNESSDLAMQLELYQKRFGMLPQEVQADKLYLGKANRNLIKTRRGPSARGTRWRPHSEPLKGFTGQTTSGRNLTTRLTHG